MKALLLYIRLIFLVFVGSLDFQVNQGNVHTTLTVQKDVLALKGRPH